MLFFYKSKVLFKKKLSCSLFNSLELLKEVTSMISCEIENVEQQQLILGRKLELIDSIDEQYKEQIKLLNQQVLFYPKV